MEIKGLTNGKNSNTIVYTITWNPTKSVRLKRIRGVSFEEIIKAKFLAIQEHHSRNDQKMLVFDYKGYIWVVPCVIEKETVFLKTLYPSRKYRKLHKKR